jgi:hypothetical protein
MSEVDQQVFRQGLAALKRHDWQTGAQLLDPLLATAAGGDRTKLLTALAHAYRQLSQPWLASLRTAELHQLPDAPAWTESLLKELQPNVNLHLQERPTASLPPWGQITLLALVVEMAVLLYGWLPWPLTLLLGIGGLTLGRTRLEAWLGPLELRGREGVLPVVSLGCSLVMPLPLPGLWISVSLFCLGLVLGLSHLPLGWLPPRLGWQPLPHVQLFRSSSTHITCWLIPLETLLVVSFGSASHPHIVVSQGFLGRLPQRQRELLLQRERSLVGQRCSGLLNGVCLLAVWLQQQAPFPGQLWLQRSLIVLQQTLEGASQYRAYLGDRPIAGRSRLAALTQALVTYAQLLGQDLRQQGCPELLFNLDRLQPVRLTDGVLCTTLSPPLLLTDQTALGQRLGCLTVGLLPPLVRLSNWVLKLLVNPWGMGALAATLLGGLILWLALIGSWLGQAWADSFWSDPTWLWGMPWLGAAGAGLLQFNMRFSSMALGILQGDWLPGPLPLLRTATELILLRAPARSETIGCQVQGWRRMQAPTVFDVESIRSPQGHLRLLQRRWVYLAVCLGFTALGLYLLLV